MKQRILIAILALTVCPLAFAHHTSSTAKVTSPGEIGAHVTTGWYQGISAGYGGMDTATLSSDDKAAANLNGEHYKSNRMGFTWGIDAGYLWQTPTQPNIQYGAEMSYTHSPDNKYQIGSNQWYTKKTFEGYNIAVMGVVRYLCGHTGLTLIGKVGMAYVAQKAWLTRHDFVDPELGLLPNYRTSRSKNDLLPKVSVGVGYDITQHIGVNILYSRIFGKSNNRDLDRISSVDTIMLGVTYHY